MDFEFISEYYDPLRAFALQKCGEADLSDELVQDTFVAALDYLNRGGSLENPLAFLKTVLGRRYNQYLREKYRSREQSYDRMDVLPDRNPSGRPEKPENRLPAEYEAVRREVSRLSAMYREVVVRHYMKGQKVEEIAAEMGIPKGTVLTRLRQGRIQIKDGMTNMEKFTQSSYDPKRVVIGIWGSASYRGEPFNLADCLIAQNLLIEAYKKPLSVQALADRMGVACVFVEEFVERLVAGELLGRTPGGLIYTRCLLIPASEAYGDIPAQEALAKAYLPRIWQAVDEELNPLRATESWKVLRPKQQTILTLSVVHSAVLSAVNQLVYAVNDRYDNLPERPNGGRWIAIGTVHGDGERLPERYSTSGPVEVRDPSLPGVYMKDIQSPLGNGHWLYGVLKRPLRLGQVLQLYHSLIPPQTVPADATLTEAIPEFKAHHILTEDSSGATVLDIPYLTLEDDRILSDCVNRAAERLKADLADGVKKLTADCVRDIPAQVDGREDLLDYGVVSALPLACCYALLESGTLGDWKMGELPMIVLRYPGKGERQEEIFKPTSFSDLAKVKGMLADGKRVKLSLEDFAPAIVEYLRQESILTPENHASLREDGEITLILPIPPEGANPGFTGIRTVAFGPVDPELSEDERPHTVTDPADLRAVGDFLREGKAVLLGKGDYCDLALAYLRRQLQIADDIRVEKVQANLLILSPKAG